MAEDSEEREAREARARRQREKQLKSAKEALEYVSAALLLLGVRTVSAEFNDANEWNRLGRIQFDALPPAGWPDGLAQLIDSAFRDLLPSAYDEIIDSSSGSISLDTQTGEVKIEYS